MIEAPVLIPQISIRQSTPQELPQVIRLIEDSGLEADKEPGYVESKVTHQTRTTFVADEMRKVVGSVVIEKAYQTYFGLDYLVVDKDHRGQRIGETLMARAEAEVKARGGTRIILVVESNDLSLVDFYRKYGYEKQLGVPIEMRKDF